MLLVVLSLLSACQKEVNIKPISTYTGQLFIESVLFPGKQPQVFLNRSVPFFSDGVTPQELFVRNATVSLVGSFGSETLVADSTFDYFRCRWVPYYTGANTPQQGGTYELIVTYQGETYTATTTIDQSAVQIESIEYIEEFFDVYGGHDGVKITLTDAKGAGNFYRYQMNRMMDNTRLHAHVLDVIVSDCTDGELFPTTDYGRTIFSDENIDGQQMELLIEVSFEYKQGDSTWIFIQSLDENSADFYQQLDNQLQSLINPFIEPVFIKSKIDGALGVFGSAVLSDSVLFVYPQDNP